MTSSTAKRARRNAAMDAQTAPPTAEAASASSTTTAGHRTVPERQRYHRGRCGPGQQLPFRADVEDARTKRDRHGDTRQHQRNGANQRRGRERVPGAQRPAPERRETAADGVPADEQQECRRADDREQHQARPHRAPRRPNRAERRVPAFPGLTRLRPSPVRSAHGRAAARARRARRRRTHEFARRSTSSMSLE